MSEQAEADLEKRVAKLELQVASVLRALSVATGVPAEEIGAMPPDRTLLFPPSLQWLRALTGWGRQP